MINENVPDGHLMATIRFQYALSKTDDWVYEELRKTGRIHRDTIESNYKGHILAHMVSRNILQILHQSGTSAVIKELNKVLKESINDKFVTKAIYEVIDYYRAHPFVPSSYDDDEDEDE